MNSYLSLLYVGGVRMEPIREVPSQRGMPTTYARDVVFVGDDSHTTITLHAFYRTALMLPHEMEEERQLAERARHDDAMELLANSNPTGPNDAGDGTLADIDAPLDYELTR